jgi:predicted transglutaminase-like cysteine proteinase
MLRLTKRLALCAAILSLAACVTPPRPHGAGFALLGGGLTAPPDGLMALCARDPQSCPEPGLPATLSNDLASSQAANATAALSPAPEALFQTLMSYSMNVTRAEGEADSAAPVDAQTRIALNRKHWRTLVSINRNVNYEIRPQDDLTLYGVDEFWTRPTAKSAVGLAGDCEDYALEKRVQLLAAGVPEAALRLATARAPGIGHHAVLIVSTDRGDLVLDNLQPFPVSPAELPYEWVSISGVASRPGWREARLAHRENVSASPQPEPTLTVALATGVQTHTTMAQKEAGDLSATLPRSVPSNSPKDGAEP